MSTSGSSNRRSGDAAAVEGPSSKKQKVSNNDAETLKQKMLQQDSIAKAKKVLVANNSTAVYPDNIDEMYCEFMTLKIMNEDYDASKAQLSPGGTVDEFWQLTSLMLPGMQAFSGILMMVIWFIMMY